MVKQKVGAFRDFVAQLTAQVTEQVCQEFEREVSQLFEDCTLYRNELTRCAELLGHQLGREKQLHQLLANMADHHANVATSVNVMAQQAPNHQQLHDIVDSMCGQHVDILNSTLQGVNHAHSVAQSHAQTARQHQESMISSENEFNRIVQLLQTPIIEERLPEATWAALPGTPTSLRPTSSPARPGSARGSPPSGGHGSYSAPRGPIAAKAHPVPPKSFASTRPTALNPNSPPAFSVAQSYAS